MEKTLIAYGSRYGATVETAAEIASILNKEFDLDVDIYNLKKYRACPDLDIYDNVIVASGIKYSDWTENAESFLKNDFSNKKLAIFISSGYAGEPELYEYSYNNFLKAVIEKYEHLKPIAIEAFGGRIPLRKIPEIHYMRIMERLPYFQRDNRDWDKIREWARKVGKEFVEE
jgi:menaquinone-dependent protoporphyrinogen IX oxidase